MKIFVLALTLVSQNLAGNSLNSSLGASFALGGNFGEQQTQKSSFIPKISSKYKTSTANTRICLDSTNQTKNAESALDSANSQNLVKNSEKIAESVKNQSREAQPLASSGQVSNGGKGAVREGEGSDFAIRKNPCIQAPTPSLKENARGKKGDSNADLSAQAREEKDSTESQNLQGGLPRSHLLARNNENLDSSVALLPQNDNFGLDSAPSTHEANSSIFDEKSGLRSHEREDRTNGSSTKRVASLPDLSQKDAEFVDSALCKDDIIGFWLSPLDKVSARTSIIEIFKKDGKYFAYNVAFLDELPPKKDALNQNFALRDREILGSVYAYNLERSGERSYINGRYYDFNKGKIFHLKAKLDCNELILLISADNVGFLGKKKIYKGLEKNEAELYIKTRPTIDFSGVK